MRGFAGLGLGGRVGSHHPARIIITDKDRGTAWHGQAGPVLAVQGLACQGVAREAGWRTWWTPLPLSSTTRSSV